MRTSEAKGRVIEKMPRVTAVETESRRGEVINQAIKAEGELGQVFSVTVPNGFPGLPGIWKRPPQTKAPEME